MKCPHCGEELPEGFVYIPPKQESTSDEQETVVIEHSMHMPEPGSGTEANDDSVIPSHSLPMYPSDNNAVPYLNTANRKTDNKYIILVAAAAIMIIALISAGLKIHTSSLLHNKICGSWQSMNLITEAQLTVTEDTISYSESFGFVQMNVQTVPYKVVSSDTIKIRGIKHKVTFDASQGIMTITPGIASNGSEVWYSRSARSDTGESNNTDDRSNEQENRSSDDVL